MGAVENLPNNKAYHIPEEAREILKSLASQWDDLLNANELQVIPLKGALTNEVFQIKWPTKTEDTSRKVVVRIYGEGVDVFFDRDHAMRTFEFMTKNGRGPLLLGHFANGRIEEFIHARTLSASDLRDPVISALIAPKLMEFHDLDMPGPKKVHLWDRLRNWLSVAKRLSPPEEVESLSLGTIEEEISILEKELSRYHQRMGFCHNDLQYGNIMLDEETNSVTIIDFEYSSYNPVAYDIANHFCEMAANYHTETPHILDYSKYPDLEERKKFVRLYLTSSGGQPSDIEVEQLLQDIEKYTLANHLFWGLWGIISGHVNKIEFDYMEYAKQRFQQYWSSKYSLLGSVGPSLDDVIDNRPSPVGVPDDKPSPAGVASDKPSSNGVSDKPSPTSHHTDKPFSFDGVNEGKLSPTSHHTDKPFSSDGVTEGKPSPTGHHTDKSSSSDAVAEDKPAPTSHHTDKPSSSDGVTEDKPSPASVTSDKPSSDGVTSDKPDDKPSPAGVASDKPSSGGVTEDKPCPAPDDKPSSNGVTRDKPHDKPSPAGVASDKPSSDGVTDDKPSSAIMTSDEPSSNGVTGDKPSSDSVTADKPSSSGATKDEASPVATDGEISSAKGTHARNLGVFKKLKKYLTLSFFRAKN